jgi:hypothetical protein
VAAQLPPTDRQTTGHLFRRIVNGLNGLVDRQVQLVKQEIKEDILAALGAGKVLGIGIGVAVVGALIVLNVLMMMLVLGLNELGSWFIPYVGPFLGWIVAIILIVAVFLVAYVLVRRGIQQAKITPVQQTRESLREDIEWAKQLLTRNGR